MPWAAADAAAAADGPLAFVAAKGTWNLAGEEDIMTMKYSYDAGDRVISHEREEMAHECWEYRNIT